MKEYRSKGLFGCFSYDDGSTESIMMLTLPKPYILDTSLTINLGVAINGNYQKGVSVDYEIEVVEIDSNGTKSKIKVLSNKNRRGEIQPAIVSSQSIFGDLYWKTKIADQLDNTWIETNSIEWLSNPASERDKKITEILK